MGRKANPPAALPVKVNFNEEALAQLDADAKEIGAIDAAAEAHVRAVALQIGYQLPGDCTDADLIQRDIAVNMRRSVEACLEVGRGLKVLKAACQHGNFMARLDVLCIEPGVAQRFMQAAARFSNAAAPRLLKAAGNQSKLFEMIVLDNDQIEELELTGQTGELHLDDVATMSMRDLRAAVRKERLVAGRLKDVNSELNTELALKQNLKLAATDWPQRFKGLMDQADLAHRTMKQCIDSLEAVRIAAIEDKPDTPEEEDSLQRARETLAESMLHAQRSCAERLEVLGGIFDKTLGAYTSGSVWK